MKAATMLPLESAPISDMIQALASGRVTATGLTEGYLARIEAYDSGGPRLNSVRVLNPDALTVAGKGGFISGTTDGKDTPDYPLGITFAGRAWSEHKLLRLAYAYGQASNMRKRL